MRILFMADMPPDPNLGASGTEYQTIDALRRLGHEVDTIWTDALPHRIKHGNLHYLFELPFAFRRLMLMKLNRSRYDVIHVNQPHGYLAAKELSKMRKETVFIHRSHGFELRVQQDLAHWKRIYDRDKRPSWRRIVSGGVASALSHSSRSICQYADGHIVYARQCGAYLHDKMGLPSERIAVIPAAAPTSFIEEWPPKMTPERLRRVLYVGQFAFIKAPIILAKAFNRLAEADEDFKFTWVCSKQHHPDAAALLTEKARERVDLLDWMPQDELIRVYDEHGIFLFPSFFEGFGKVFLEAMSRGLCVVAADNGGARDVIIQGASGMLSPTGCADTMVRQCLELTASSQLANGISEAAAKCARSYTWERVAKDTVSFYNHRLNAKLQESRTPSH